MWGPIPFSWLFQASPSQMVVPFAEPPPGPGGLRGRELPPLIPMALGRFRPPREVAVSLVWGLPPTGCSRWGMWVKGRAVWRGTRDGRAEQGARGVWRLGRGLSAPTENQLPLPGWCKTDPSDPTIWASFWEHGEKR